jgi:hypothetical protein
MVVTDDTGNHAVNHVVVSKQLSCTSSTSGVLLSRIQITALLGNSFPQISDLKSYRIGSNLAGLWKVVVNSTVTSCTGHKLYENRQLTNDGYLRFFKIESNAKNVPPFRQAMMILIFCC